MKKRILFRILLLLLLIHLCVGASARIASFTATAEDTKSAEKADELLDESVNELLNNLDLQALEEYLDSLGLKGDKTLLERLTEYVRVGAIDYTKFTEDILKILFTKIGELLPAFLCIIGITLLSGILSALQSNTTHTTAEVVFIVCYIGALLPLLIIVTQCFQTVIGSIRGLQKQMELTYPLLLTLMAVSGGNVTASVCRPAVAFFSTSIVAVLEGVVFPITVLIILFSMSANLTDSLKIQKFSTFFKSINKWIIGLCVSVFGIFFTLQGLTASTYDGIVRRATKYAIGNGVPIVGGFLSGGFDLAVAGSVLIKNALGNMSIFLMLFVLLEPILLMISVNILLRLTSAITQPFGDSRISNFLGETADNLQYCTAGLLFTGFLYFLSILLFVTGTEALF